MVFKLGLALMLFVILPAFLFGGILAFCDENLWDELNNDPADEWEGDE